MDTQRDHGGNLDDAIARYGGARADWLDLSTGINPVPYPMPALPAHSLGCLPTQADITGLEATARTAYGCQAACLAVSGAQAAIQLMPRLAQPGRARVLGPTYNEHAASLSAQGWQVETVTHMDALFGADLAVIVTPNNPDGRQHSMDERRRLADQVGLLIVDESFGDPDPANSLAPSLHRLPNTLILRSFGKFYGLAGLRLGFVLGDPARVAALRALAGPWAVNGPAIVAGSHALADRHWHRDTCARLAQDAATLDGLAIGAGWSLLGGTPLFRTYVTPCAQTAQNRLAQAHIWTRRFPYSDTWLRLGLPAPQGWARLTAALTMTGATHDH